MCAQVSWPLELLTIWSLRAEGRPTAIVHWRPTDPDPLASFARSQPAVQIRGSTSRLIQRAMWPLADRNSNDDERKKALSLLIIRLQPVSLQPACKPLGSWTMSALPSQPVSDQNAYKRQAR